MPVKLTRREFALSQLSNAPLDAQIVVPEKRVSDLGAEREWHLHAAAIKEVRARQKLTRSLSYISAGSTQTNLTPQRRAFAKMLGWRSGILDLVLFWNRPFKMHWVEFKLPGGKLSPEQQAEFAYWAIAGAPCSRVDNLKDFLSILDKFCRNDDV